MKSLILIILLFNTYVLAQNATNKNERVKENIKKQLELEKKYSKEQTFDKGKDYNLKEHQVDQGLVDSIPEQRKIDYDFDMNDVYD